MTLNKLNFLNTNLVDIIYPVGSVVCLYENSSTPNSLFGNIGTWIKIADTESIKISTTFDNAQINNPEIALGGTVSNTTLTASQIPVFASSPTISGHTMRLYDVDKKEWNDLSSSSWVSAYRNHYHNARANIHPTVGDTTATWYIDYATSWVTSAKALTTGSTASYYYISVSATANLSSIGQTPTYEVSHTHTYQAVGNGSQAAHKHDITTNTVTLSINPPSIGMNIWVRTA